jgi:hypothetical protein
MAATAPLYARPAIIRGQQCAEAPLVEPCQARQATAQVKPRKPQSRFER